MDQYPVNHTQKFVKNFMLKIHESVWILKLSQVIKKGPFDQKLFYKSQIIKCVVC